jgi:phosphoserine phosphatase
MMDHLRLVLGDRFRSAIVSGGFMFAAERVAIELGFDSYSANDLEIDRGLSGTRTFTGMVSNQSGLAPGRAILDAEAKRDILCRLRDEFRADAVIAIGDGANDIPMLLEATHGIAFGTKEKVRSAASLHLDTGNLAHVLSILGL